MSCQVELDKYKQQIADLYSSRSDNYDNGDWHPRIAHRLVEYTHLRPGQQVLDIATGTGMVAIEAAQIVGSEGKVIGIDIATGMVEQARRKVEVLGLSNIEFQVADAEDLDFPDDFFDYIFCSSAFIWMSDLLSALRLSLGYTVVYTEDQMNQAVNSAKPPEKILGVFAATNTFDDRNEEALGLNTASPKPLYIATAPTVAEMLEASLKVLKRDPDGFFVVVEEEGTDNFGNSNNAVGTIEAIRRADAAIGVAQKFVNTQDPNTLVITAADSDAGGLQVVQYAPYARPAGNSTTDFALQNSETQVPFIGINPTTTNTTRSYLDGANGSTASTEFPWKPFQSKDSIDGPMGNFGVSWVGTPDFPGSIVAKTYGLNADKLPSTLDNTEIYNLMYKTLFGTSSQKTLVPGTAGADDLVAGFTPGFDGVNDLVFTGAGNDKVDVTIAGAVAGNNRIDAGSGADRIDVGNSDRVFGSAGDDTLDATEVKDYRIAGGAGNDTLFLGANGRALGGSSSLVVAVITFSPVVLVPTSFGLLMLKFQQRQIRFWTFKSVPTLSGFREQRVWGLVQLASN